MKHKITYILMFIGFLGITSCGNFGDINIDPNNPSQADTRFLFTRTMQGITFSTYSSAPAPSVSMYDPFSQLYPQYFAEIQNIQYTEFGIVDFSLGIYYHTFIRNLNLIIAMNNDEKQKNTEFVANMGSNSNQIALARTLKAFYYMHMTDILGMIPYKEALLGDEGNFTPKYDTQKDIYTDLDKELSEAYTQFKENEDLNSTADVLYQGNVAKWKKLNATLRMFMAIKLSDIEPETGKARFAKAFADGGIHTNEDNLVYKYLSEQANRNPLFDNMLNAGARRDFGPSKTIVDMLLQYKDPRVASYCVPSPAGKYDAIPFGVARNKVSEYKGKICMFNPKHYQINTPLTIFSASRVLLVEAEAAVRGWITANAEQLYKEAIKLSFEYNDIATEKGKYAEQFANYGLITSESDYLAQAIVALTGSVQDKINKIAMQRWLNGFNQSGIEAWSDWRRLNVPTLKPGEASPSITHIPYRRYYYSVDYETNMDNYKAAIETQGADNFDTRVWWDTANNN